MNSIEKFGEAVAKLLDERGWHSIPRRELTIRILDAAMKSGLIAETISRYDLAVKLRVSPGVVDGLLRDRSLYCNQFAKMDIKELAKWAEKANQTTQEDIKKGLFVFQIRNSSEQLPLEALLDELGIVADYKNNKRLLCIDILSLINKITTKKQLNNDFLARIFNNKSQREAVIKEINKDKDIGIPKLLKEAVKEQIGKRLGEKTTELFIELCKSVYKPEI
jgi:hypothetical protein